MIWQELTAVGQSETHTVTRFGYKIALSTMGSRFAPRSVLLSIDAQAA